ncbi:MAG: transporter substrate-binding domain-containing protein [Oscillospiraceae bacterium]|nr:transporter substrate-binding domain-containing protein [Oscillospiraceae bacterium]
MNAILKKTLLPVLAGLFLLSSGCSRKQEESSLTLPETNGIQAISDLNGKKIGIQIGTTGELYAEDIPDVQIQSFTKPSAAVKALKEQKIDAVILDSEPARVLTEADDSCRILVQSLVEEEYSIAYAKNNTELGHRIDNALDKLRKDGTLADISAHWIGENADQVSYHPDESLTREGTLVMATNAEFPPYESKDSLGNIVGIDVDIMTAVCDQLKMNLEIKDMQFDSILPSVQNGKADVGAAGISVTEEREQLVSFTQSYAVSKLVVIVRNG